MKKSARVIPLMGFLVTLCIQGDYVYPVGVFEDEEGCSSVLMLYQKSPQHTELWRWDPSSGEAQRALLSTFTPIGIAMLPNNAGFSFFDNGRLRVKLWQKRSPKAIDIFEPLYDLGPIQWQTEQVCYFHARERDLFTLYKMDTYDGSIEKVVSRETSDCFYPCVHGDSLWYIERSRDTSRVLLRSGDREVCLCSHNHPLAFLSRVSDEEFLVIEHPKNVNLYTDKSLFCFCCRLHKEGDRWIFNKLFSFVIPLYLIKPSGHDHLCESMYPLLPRVIGTSIYFVSQDKTGKISPYRYTDKEGVQAVLVPPTGVLSDFFTPYNVHGSLVYGGTISTHDDLYGGLWMDKDQSVFLHLPLVSL